MKRVKLTFSFAIPQSAKALMANAAAREKRRGSLDRGGEE